MFSLLKALSQKWGGCVGDVRKMLWCWRYMWESRNRCWRRENCPGWSSRRGNPFHRLEIHPQAGQPHGFIAGGEGGVCSYWILTGNTEEGTPERAMHSYRPAHKTQECTTAGATVEENKYFQKFCLRSHFYQIVFEKSFLVSNSHLSTITSKSHSQGHYYGTEYKLNIISGKENKTRQMVILSGLVLDWALLMTRSERCLTMSLSFGFCLVSGPCGKGK